MLEAYNPIAKKLLLIFDLLRTTIKHNWNDHS
jgi:hypothetical protein